LGSVCDHAKEYVQGGQESRVFGVSLSKILLIILIIVVIWKGFGLVSRLASERQAGLKRSAGRTTRTSRTDRAGTVELRQCPRCGAYVDPREGCRCAARRDEARRARF
jgi:hypothetical protein